MTPLLEYDDMCIGTHLTGLELRYLNVFDVQLCLFLLIEYNNIRIDTHQNVLQMIPDVSVNGVCFPA